MMKACQLKNACRCGSLEGHIIAPTGNCHPAKLVCWECGRFIRWLGRQDFERAVRCGFVDELGAIKNG